MKLNKTQQLILDLINEYDEKGYILDEKLLAKYSLKIKELHKENKKLNKLHLDLTQTKVLAGNDTIPIDYVLDCITNENY